MNANETKPQFSQFDKYVSWWRGDTVSVSIGNVEFIARIVHDGDYHIDDDDCHNEDQSVTGCDDDQHARLLDARQKWFNDEWFYCGVTVTSYVDGVELASESLWGIECNYPVADDSETRSNAYLSIVANELLSRCIVSTLRKLGSASSGYDNGDAYPASTTQI